MFVITSILEFAGGFLKQLPDGDTVDRLNYYWTPAVFNLLASALVGWSYWGQNIECWFPSFFSKYWEQYALDICFVQGTYYVPFFNTQNSSIFAGKQMQSIPLDPKIQDKTSISYYQWVPFILCLQSLAFYTPMIIWRKLYENGNIPVEDICKLGWYKAGGDAAKESEAELKSVAGYIALKHSRDDIKWGSMFRGNYLVLSYLFTKLLFVMNSVAQFLFLMKVFGATDYMWGWETTKAIWSGIDAEESANFPRVTICQFAIRMLGEPKVDYRVQCVLFLNFIHEKIFLLQWYYLLFLLAVNTASFLRWTFCSYACHSVIQDYNDKKFMNFVRQDGIFLLRLLSANHGELVVRDLKTQLWNDFISLEDKAKKKKRVIQKNWVKEPMCLESTV